MLDFSVVGEVRGGNSFKTGDWIWDSGEVGRLLGGEENSLSVCFLFFVPSVSSSEESSSACRSSGDSSDPEEGSGPSMSMKAFLI